MYKMRAVFGACNTNLCIDEGNGSFAFAAVARAVVTCAAVSTETSKIRSIQAIVRSAPIGRLGGVDLTWSPKGGDKSALALG